MATVLAIGLLAVDAAGAAAAPRVSIASPWTKDDTIGDASRPQGDVRKVIVENRGSNVRFTFRMQAKPVWDTVGTSRATIMQFLVDWQGTGAAYDRRIAVSYSEGDWRIVTYNGSGGAVCVSQSGVVQSLGNFRYRFAMPAGGPVPCMGGQHVLRVAAQFRDDRDDSAGNDIRVDKVPNSGGYSPFIRLP
jgi:hypothetical protein